MLLTLSQEILPNDRRPNFCFSLTKGKFCIIAARPRKGLGMLQMPIAKSQRQTLHARHEVALRAHNVLSAYLRIAEPYQHLLRMGVGTLNSE